MLSYTGNLVERERNILFGWRNIRFGWNIFLMLYFYLYIPSALNCTFKANQYFYISSEFNSGLGKFQFSSSSTSNFGKECVSIRPWNLIWCCKLSFEDNRILKFWGSTNLSFKKPSQHLIEPGHTVCIQHLMLGIFGDLKMSILDLHSFILYSLSQIFKLAIHTAD